MFLDYAADHLPNVLTLKNPLGPQTTPCPVRRKTQFSVFLIVLTLLIMGAQGAFAKDISRQVVVEVDQLISFVETSGCQFNRNGKWYDSEEAAKHIAKKYRYVKKRGLVKTTEDFIKYAATKSSMSGKIYRVKCADGKVVDCSAWLTKELAKYRAVK